MKNEATELTEEISDRALKGAKEVDKAMHKYPYKAIGIAASIGALAGFVIGRRCSKDNS